MGMAGGAYKGDMERARLALQAQSIANQAAGQRRAAALRERELNQRQQMIDAANRERQAAAERASMHGKAGRKWLGGGAGDQGGQGAAPAGRQSPYSVSAFDLGAAARQRANDQRLMALERQNNTLGQFQQVVNMERQQAAAKKAQGQATVASLMKMAKLNGGVAPIAALELATRQMGFDGKTAAIGGAGFTANGDFFLDFVQKDAQTGQMSRATNLIGRADQGRIYYGQQGIFDNADRAAWRQQMLGARYSDQEINQLAGLNATAIEGLDEAGRKRLADGFVDPAGGSDWKRDIAYRKLALQEQRLARSLGQSSLTDAQKFAMHNFKKFMGRNRPATEDDVKKGVLGASKVGDTILMTPEDGFNAAVEFYNNMTRNQDPATNPQGGDQGGQQPAPGTEANPPAPGSEAQPPAAPAAGGEAPAGGDAALPKEAREIVNPQEATAEGQGELDFGGEAAPAGEAPATGGEGGAPAEGGGEAAPAPAEGAAPAGESAPPPPPPAEGGEAPAGGEEDENISASNPFGKWIKKKSSEKKVSKAERDQDDVLANPQDGDELPLKGGGFARYNGQKKKWEEAVA